MAEKKITISKEQLLKLAAAIRTFVQSGNDLIDSQFGKEVQKAAKATVDALVSNGDIAKEKSNEVVSTLVWEKVAALRGLQKIAAKKTQTRTPLGTVKESSVSKDSESVEFYNSQFGV